jgi:SAM-dependent methyltransferase
MEGHIFDFSGFARHSDLSKPEWNSLFQELEREQTRFLLSESVFRSKEYRWPRDPLHTWSRLWEYPYTFYHLKEIKNKKKSNQILKVADIGSGVTFFPFTVSNLGYEVICVDNDPVCEKDLSAAINVVESGPGSVSALYLESENFPIEDSSQDVVYCISVIEHIPNFEKTISEISRILKPGGKFILTNDIDLKGNFELGVESFNKIQKNLKL